MLINRIGSLFKPHNYKTIHRLASLRLVSSSPPHEEPDEAPVKYSQTAASKWKVRNSYSGPDSNRLWYEPYVVVASVAVFLLYFCVLREENDIDIKLSQSLFSQVEGLEEAQLRATLEYNRNNNLETSAIIKRLEEIEQSKTAAEDSV